MKLFQIEGDVREWLRATYRGEVFWIEPGRGSSVGMPDCVLQIGGRAIFAELKLGRVGRGGVVRYRVRPEQRQTARRMRANGHAIVVVIGVRGTDQIYIAPSVDNVLWGEYQPTAFCGEGETVCLNSNSFDHDLRAMIERRAI